MNYRVEIDNRAARQIRHLGPDIRQRVIEALDDIRSNPRPPRCAKLKGQALPSWRVRIGDYRIL